MKYKYIAGIALVLAGIALFIGSAMGAGFALIAAGFFSAVRS